MAKKWARSNMSWGDDEISHMQHALEIAEKGRGQVRPNPLVGCVLVKNGQIIAEGWHDHIGGLHAEQMAIHDAEANGHVTNGSIAYITLEPCNHFGRTPPCTEALLWAGVSEVIVAHSDPNPNVRGDGISVLEEAGIKVQSGLLKEQAAVQMREFLYWCEKRRPWVTVKIAVDANNSVDDRAKASERFTSEECLTEVHRLRKDCDAILVGVETVIRDNPSLTVRLVETKQQPLRLIVDPNERCPPSARILNDENATRHLTTDFRGLDAMLDMLGDLEIQRLLVEGGPKTINHFLEEGLVNEFILVKSKIEHLEPLIADFDLTQFSQSNETSWGNEKVIIHS